jgi:hypothetical protein
MVFGIRFPVTPSDRATEAIETRLKSTWNFSQPAGSLGTHYPHQEVKALAAALSGPLWPEPVPFRLPKFLLQPLHAGHG